MTKSLQELSYELVELYRSTFKVTSDVDIRLFKEWVRQSRVQLIKQRLDTLSVIDDSTVQDLGPVAFAPVTSSVKLTVPSDKFMLRSVSQIPSSINRRTEQGTFTRIGSADLLEAKFNFTNMERALRSGNGRFNSNDIYAYLNGGYMYLISKSNLHKYITSCSIFGVFNNPEEAYTFNVNNAGTPWNDDMNFFVSPSIVMDLQNMILDKKFKLILTQADDRVSNGVDDTTITRMK